MNKVTKILVTAIAVIIFIVLLGALIAIRESSGHRTPGMLGLILFAGLVGAIRAIWKKQSNDDDTDASILQK